LTNPEEFAGYVTEDAVWWNSALPWEIRNIVSDGDIVMTERVDHFLVGTTRISVPCMGIFQLRDGKISAWRDYWNLQQFERQLPPQA
jgi:limonene-1,2-epoxide hydrolase